MKPKLLKFPLTRKPPRPPASLGKAGRRLWKSIQAEYLIVDAGGLSHLVAAARCEDDLEKIRRQIAIQGDMVVDPKNNCKQLELSGYTIEDPKKGMQPHPLLRFVPQLEAARR